MQAKIVIDIDNTLWDFAPVLYERIKEINPDITLPSEWRTWDFWQRYLTSKALYEVIRGIHMEQDRFIPYPDAELFLALLRKNGFFIIIASHREKGTLDATEQWLINNNLLYDEIHLSHDKTVLFDDCWAVVDDSPITLDKAASLGIVRAGLRNPWNEQENHPLFKNLMEIFSYLKKECASSRKN
jgi:hypothetical protein